MLASYNYVNFFPQVLQTAGENLVSNDSSPLSDENSHVDANTSLDFKHFNSFLLSSTLDIDYSKTQAFDYTTIVYEVGLELETVSLISESEFDKTEFDRTASDLRLHHYRSTLFYGDLLNSYWNEWTYHMVSQRAMNGCAYSNKKNLFVLIGTKSWLDMCDCNVWVCALHCPVPPLGTDYHKQGIGIEIPVPIR